ncbi:MAG: nucleoside monophosphate kinase [Myxococcales bacterium]|nr:nucleoside monophosphate kinase [Myxococcales bacterium]
MFVLLFGPPGSGKGTQAVALAARLCVPHVATGDIFRRHLREGTELGRRVRGYMDRGQLVPDLVTCDLVGIRLAEPDAAGGVLFDGFPRSVPQLYWLIGHLGAGGRTVAAVLNLQVPDDAILTRVTGRRTCTNCGATYHVFSAPPRADGSCARCGAAVVQRKDDSDEVVRDRLVAYSTQTYPCLSELRDRLPVHDISGEGEIGEVQRRIFAALAL